MPSGGRTRRAAELKAQVELIENQQKMTKLREPAAPPDPQGLRAETEQPELQARLVRAHALIEEPTRSLYLLRTTQPES